MSGFKVGWIPTPDTFSQAFDWIASIGVGFHETNNKEPTNADAFLDDRVQADQAHALDHVQCMHEFADTQFALVLQQNQRAQPRRVGKGTEQGVGREVHGVNICKNIYVVKHIYLSTGHRPAHSQGKMRQLIVI